MRYSIPIFLSGLCFAASLVVHILGWREIVPPFGQGAFVLHVFIFVLFVPLVLLLRGPKGNKRRFSSGDFLKGQPLWAQRAVQVLFGYAIAHFFLFLYQTQQYSKKGVPLYLELRGFSGHWMMFYAFCAFGYLELRRRLSDEKDA